MENFKEIPGYKKYKISTSGVIIRISDQKTMSNKARGEKARPTVCLTNDNGQSKKELVSRLVALTFIPNNDKTKIEVDHIDRNIFNNSVENLRWVTKSENCQNRDNVQLSKNFDGKRKQRSVIKFNNCEEWIYSTIADAARSLNPLDSKDFHTKCVNIQACCSGKQKTCCGYFFKYN